MWKHQLPSIFCKHQPTGGSYLSQLQLTSIKLQPDREAPTSLLLQKKNTCWFTLDITSVMYLLLCYSSTLISDLHHLCSAPSSSLLNSSLFTFFLQLAYSLQLSLILLHTLFFSHSFFVNLSPWVLSYYIQTSFMVVCILLGIRNGQSCLFAFCLLNPFICLFRKYNCRYQFNIIVGICSLSETFQCITNNKNIYIRIKMWTPAQLI